MATELEKWNAAQKGPEEFAKVYDPGGKNPGASAHFYEVYKNTSRDSIVSQTKVKISEGWRTAGNAAQGVANLADIKNGTFGGSERIGLSEVGKGIGQLAAALSTGGWKSVGRAALGGVADQSAEVYRQERDIRNDINKSMGVTGKLGDDIRDTIMTTASYGQRFGFSIADASDSFKKLNEQTGTFATFSNKILERGFSTAGAFLKDLGDLGTSFAEFEKVGIGYKDTLDQIDNIGKQSMIIGLNGRKTVEEIKTNIEKLNSFNFKNGTEGLAQMSRIAKIFRTDMNDAFKVAEKVMDPEGAIEMSAKLQALGGNIGEFNDVYKLMYDSVNDPEAIQKALINMSSGLASFNEQAGKFELTSVGIRMLREQANITGADYNNLARSAIAAQEKMRGLQQLAMNGMMIKPEEKDFLLNLAHMEHGEMKITIPPDLQDKFAKLGGAIEKELKDTGMISFKNMNQEAFARFQDYQDQFTQAFPEDIARGQYTLIQNISNDVASMLSFARARAVKTAGGALSGMGLEAGAQYAAKLLDINIRNLTKDAESNKGYSGSVKAKVQEAINFLSFGLVEKAKKAFNEADMELTRKRSKQRAEDAKGTTNQISTKGLVQDVLYGNPSASNNNAGSTLNQPKNVNVVVSFAPGSAINEVQRSALRDPSFVKNLFGDSNPNSYDNNVGMLGAVAAV